MNRPSQPTHTPVPRTPLARWSGLTAALPVLGLLAAFFGPTAARAASGCETSLAQIEEGRLVVKGLQRSRDSLIRQRRARVRGNASPGKSLEQIEWMLGPIEAQLRALLRDLPRQERAYVRCVEAELDGQPRAHQ